MSDIFNGNGAMFSDCGKHREYLWRIWDESKPKLMFIGLNPSTANADSDDPTIRKLKAICAHNGYGGFYMLNLFTYISTDPKQLNIKHGNVLRANENLLTISDWCEFVVCAWGNFNVLGRDIEVRKMFPKSMALKVNKNGSPKHPLYCKNESTFVNYDI